MDAQSKAAVTVLEALATASERLIGIASALRSRPEVTQSLQGFTLRNLRQPGPIVEAYVDVELQNGKAAAWVLDITWNDTEWTVQAQVVANHESGDRGQDVLRNIADVRARTLGEFVQGLDETLQRLEDSAVLLSLHSLRFDEPPSVSALQ